MFQECSFSTCRVSPMWNGWGVDAMNTRFQPASAAGLSASQVPQLKLKWAFGFPGATVSYYNQPTSAGGRVYVASDTGYVYALDAATGCVYWSFQARAVIRSTISVGPVKGQPAKYAAYFGDMQANVYAVDATNGMLLWKVFSGESSGRSNYGRPQTLLRASCTFPSLLWRRGRGRQPEISLLRISAAASLRSTPAPYRRIWKAYTILKQFSRSGKIRKVWSSGAHQAAACGIRRPSTHVQRHTQST